MYPIDNGWLGSLLMGFLAASICLVLAGHLRACGRSGHHDPVGPCLFAWRGRGPRNHVNGVLFFGLGNRRPSLPVKPFGRCRRSFWVARILATRRSSGPKPLRPSMVHRDRVRVPHKRSNTMKRQTTTSGLRGVPPMAPPLLRRRGRDAAGHARRDADQEPRFHRLRRRRRPAPGGREGPPLPDAASRTSRAASGSAGPPATTSTAWSAGPGCPAPTTTVCWSSPTTSCRAWPCPTTWKTCGPGAAAAT